MEDGNLSFLCVAIWLLLLWLNGILYGFAAAMQNINETEVERRAKEGDKASGQLLRLLEKPVRYINAIPVMVMTAGITFGVFLFPGAVYLLQEHVPRPAAVVLVILIAVILTAGIGILAFRRVGRGRPERFACRYVRLVWPVTQVLYPLTMLISWISRIAARPFGITMNEIQDAVTEEEIISMVDEAHEQGVIEENEAEMIQNIMAFNETEAGDIMTHRKNIVGFEETVLLQEMVDIMLEEGNSRYPVFRENIDNIIGIVHYKDALKFLTKNPWAKFKALKELPGLIREAAFIPETRGIGDLFHTMQAEKLHMAVVLDEYGQTAGIVSMEDILEEIVGEILDEYDEDEVQIRTQVDNSVVIDGLTKLEDVEEELGIRFGDCDFETLNGVLTSILGHIPTARDLDKEVEAGGYRFHILSLGNKTIGKVKAEKIN
ncbi:MAG: HlyC/CorC family transporter [Blautia sp.]|nr:HlyC/CorC family transporter [Blautia sp.]